MVKIVSLPLCLANSGVDWRLAVALGISATRFWSKWYDVRWFIELCNGLKTLSSCTSKDEAERVLVYATLFGDYDFIIKLEPLLLKYRSLRTLSSLF